MLLNVILFCPYGQIKHGLYILYIYNIFETSGRKLLAFYTSYLMWFLHSTIYNTKPITKTIQIQYINITTTDSIPTLIPACEPICDL